jgi:hypothetical protein
MNNFMGNALCFGLSRYVWRVAYFAGTSGGPALGGKLFDSESGREVAASGSYRQLTAHRFNFEWNETFSSWERLWSIVALLETGELLG